MYDSRYCLHLWLDRIRKFCHQVVTHRWFDYLILLCIAFNCITLAMERPDIPSHCVVCVIQLTILTIAKLIIELQY